MKVASINIKTIDSRACPNGHRSCLLPSCWLSAPKQVWTRHTQYRVDGRGEAWIEQKRDRFVVRPSGELFSSLDKAKERAEEILHEAQPSQTHQ